MHRDMIPSDGYGRLHTSDSDRLFIVCRLMEERAPANVRYDDQDDLLLSPRKAVNAHDGGCFSNEMGKHRTLLINLGVSQIFKVGDTGGG